MRYTGMRRHVSLVALLLSAILISGNAQSICFKKGCSGNTESDGPAVIWESKSTSTDTTAAASLTLNEWNRFTISSALQNEQQDVNDEWVHSVSLGDNMELCFEPKDGLEQKFHMRARCTFLQDITGAQQAFYFAIGVSGDGEGVADGDVTGAAALYYEFTGMNDNTYTSIETEEVRTIGNGDCIQPLVWPDTTVDLVATSCQIIIRELAQ